MWILLLAVAAGLVLVVHGVIVQEMALKARLRQVGRDFERMAIKADDRIPPGVASVTINDLPVFAEWQRRIDKELGRK